MYLLDTLIVNMKFTVVFIHILYYTCIIVNKIRYSC